MKDIQVVYTFVINMESIKLIDRISPDCGCQVKVNKNCQIMYGHI